MIIYPFMHQCCRRLLLLLVIVAMGCPVAGEDHGDKLPGAMGVKMVPITPERLPDLKVPRASHYAFFLNGELTVLGGHTLGFVPTPTTEYLSDGEWHVLPMVYAHDDGVAVAMRSGKVLLAGGHAEPLGIGQSFMVEWYDPQTHSFEGFGCLYRKRALATGLELDSGRVVIAGNHMITDAIEMFDGRKLFHLTKEPSVERIMPHVLRTAPDNAIIFSSRNPKFQLSDTDVVDRVKGGPFHVPLLNEWHPYVFDGSLNHQSAIGNEAEGRYAYLILCYNDQGEKALIQVSDTVFSLLPTDCALPTKGVDDIPLLYESNVMADRQRQAAYVVAIDSLERKYILAINYGRQPAALTLYYTDPMPECGYGSPLLTHDGNIIISGGRNFSHGDVQHDNYAPLSTVWLFRFAPAETTTAGSTMLWWIVAALAVLLLAGACVYIIRRKAALTVAETVLEAPMESAETSTAADAVADSNELLQRIRALMEHERLYLRPDLKVADVAACLNTNTRYVSDAINAHDGNSFSLFVNTYRVAYAQQLLQKDPEQKISNVAMESGFSNETSFFRAFKALTGMTPREWLNGID